MNTRVQCGVTAGLAIVGAGVLAVAPLNLPTPLEATPVTADVELTASPVDAAALLVEGVAASGERAAGAAAFAPLTPGLAGAGLALRENELAYSAIRQSLDAPLWAADPTIEALEGALPEQAASIQSFRDDVLWAATNATRTPIAEALGVSPSLNGNPQAIVGAGLLQSGERFVKSAVAAPSGLVAVADGLQKSLNGQGNTALYRALQAYIDGPNYVTDPIVFAVDDVVAPPVGGDPETNPVEMDNSEITRFRGNVLLAPRDAVRSVVAGGLGVNPVTGAPVPSASTGATTLATAAGTTENSGPVTRVLNSLKATPGGGPSTTASTGGKHRAPASGGLTNLFKKKGEDKEAGAADNS